MNKFFTFIERSHKWIGLIIVVQLFLWVLSGLVFSFINHRSVSGHFIYKNNQSADVIESADLVRVLSQYPQASRVTQQSFLNQSVIKITAISAGGEKHHLVDAKTLSTIAFNQEQIIQQAKRFYQGGGTLKSATLVVKPNDENRDFELPSWRLDFDDQFGSSLYFSKQTGEFQGARTTNWRIYDFFMMLHFMDYGQRGNFNHPLIIFSALLLVVLSLSGFRMIIASFHKEDFIYWYQRIFDSSKVSIEVFDKTGKQKKLQVDKNERLMDALNHHNIELESICGGGGICGACRVRVVDTKGENAHLDLDDHDYLTDEELAQGYRLACQLSITSKMKVQIDNIQN